LIVRERDFSDWDEAIRVVGIRQPGVGQTTDELPARE
jgi:hypothetical protein